MEQQKAFRNFFGQQLLQVRKNITIKPSNRIEYIKQLWESLTISEKEKYQHKIVKTEFRDCKIST